MLIAQITDLHLKAQDKGRCQNISRLRAVLSDLKARRKKPDLILVTGDLSEGGQAASYEALKAELSSVDIPFYLAMGNHDHPEALAACFPQAKFQDGFLQDCVEGYPLRLIILDTTDSERHGGAFCERRADWLGRELSQQPQRPTLIAMHHPPTDIGITWMTTPNEAPWAKRFESVIHRHNNIVHIICGHTHRPIFKSFAGTTLSVAGAVAPQLRLDLSDIDPETADGRVLIEDSPPSYALHHWENGELTTHHVQPALRPLIRYDEAHAHIIKQTLDRL